MDLTTFRTLDEASNSTDAPTGEEELIEANDAEVLRNTLRLYGGLFVIMMVAFCILRKKFPRVYNIRNWVEDHKTDLAADQFGYIRWIWQLFLLTDSEILDECGMDALCFTRVLEFGLKLSVVGMLNALWLIPVYKTAASSPETDYITDPIVSISVSHVPSGSYRFCATVVAAYVIFGYAMYNILKEFDWFIFFRNQFLSKRMARNYTVYIQCIPREYRSNSKLLQFFQQSSSHDSILEAHLAVKIPNLKKRVAEREKLIAQLEHAINIEDVTGRTPMRRALTSLGQTRVNLIDALFEQLTALNKEITEAIENIEIQNAKRDGTYGLYGEHIEENLSISEFSKPPLLMVDVDESNTQRTQDMGIIIDTEPSPLGSPEDTPDLSSSLFSTALRNARRSSKLIVNKANQGTKLVTTLVTQEDGEPYSAGFVVFKSLRSAQAALQMTQYPEPFAMEVLEAPQPEDVFWQNVGKTHKELQLGKLFSFGLTTTLCLLWTIPMATITGLSTIEGLKGQVQFIADMLEKAPWLEPLLAQLAPLLIVVANELLKVLLEYLAMLEGPISGAVVQASLFSKLAAFMIIQTFFVSSISGGIVSELSNMAQQPYLIVEFLANSLPSRSTFYIQILLVDTCINMGFELLRVTPICMAVIRGLLGPNLTDKERETTWMGLSPLADPTEFEHADLLAGSVLYFMVYFVYATIAPITCFFMGVCFLAMGAGYRHQLVYIYPTFPDSGGKLWTSFFGIVPVCMIIAQITIVGLLALKKAAVASLMMFPLIVITILFTVYIHQKHFKMTEHLPARECIALDLKNNAAGEMDCGFLRGMYIQPELRDKEILPENTTVEREIRHGEKYVTPPNSVHGELERAFFDPRVSVAG